MLSDACTRPVSLRAAGAAFHGRLTSALTSALAEAPAVALLGPRQVGKTTLALELASTRPAVNFELESPGN